MFVNKGVILAAGDGDRLGSLTTDCPKVLLPVINQESIITYPIRALAANGIREIAVVVGYLADKVMRELGDGSQFDVKLKYILNCNYLDGTAISVRAAREWALGNPVVLCMGDHLIEANLLRRLLDRNNLNDTLCVDYAPQPHKVEEATRVIVDTGGFIRSIGKGLDCWDALDTGVFLLTNTFFQALDELVWLCGNDIEIADAIRFLVDKGYHFQTCDVSGCLWADLDTEEDLKKVREKSCV